MNFWHVVYPWMRQDKLSGACVLSLLQGWRQERRLENKVMQIGSTCVHKNAPEATPLPWCDQPRPTMYARHDFCAGRVTASLPKCRVSYSLAVLLSLQFIGFRNPLDKREDVREALAPHDCGQSNSYMLNNLCPLGSCDSKCTKYTVGNYSLCMQHMSQIVWAYIMTLDPERGRASDQP